MLFKRCFDPCLKNRGQSRALLPFSLPKKQDYASSLKDLKGDTNYIALDSIVSVDIK